ncbi:MAG: PQQ-binding-like beta-propeller repeat protein [Pseudobdellovibrionaceae bacterium]
MKNIFSKIVQSGVNILFTLSALVGLSGCSTLQSWSESLPAPRKEYKLQKLWVRSTLSKDNLEFRKINRMTPVLLGNLVIQGNGLDGIQAFDRESGQLQWRLPVTNGIEASAALINDRLFFGASDGAFYSINARTGEVLWTFKTGTENIAEPLLQDGKIYFLAGNNTLYALDAVDGKQLWLYSRPDTSSFSIRGGAKPVINNKKLYTGFADGSFIAFNADTGALLWESRLNKNKKFRDIDAMALVDGDNVYISGYDDKLYCLNQNNGDIVWKLDQGGYSGITLYGEKLLYSTTDGDVLSIDKNTGKNIWRYKLKSGLATQAQVLKGFVIFGESQGDLKFLDFQTGKEVISFTPGRGVMAAPLVDEQSHKVYFISGEANLYALELLLDYPERWTR